MEAHPLLFYHAAAAHDFENRRIGRRSASFSLLPFVCSLFFIFHDSTESRQGTAERAMSLGKEPESAKQRVARFSVLEQELESTKSDLGRAIS